MITVPKEMKNCLFCKHYRQSTCEELLCLTHALIGFKLNSDIESYAKACFESGIRYANEAQEEKDDEECEDLGDHADRLYEERNGK